MIHKTLLPLLLSVFAVNLNFKAEFPAGFLISSAGERIVFDYGFREKSFLLGLSCFFLGTPTFSHTKSPR